MITINVLGDAITGSCNGKTFGISYDKETYKQMVKLQKEADTAGSIEEVEAVIALFEPLTQENFKTTIEGASKYLHVNEKTKQTFLKYNGVVSNVPMPEKFVTRLNESIEKDIDIEPMVKFWIRTLRNPKLTSSKLEKIVDYISATYVDNSLAAQLIKDHGISQEVATERARILQVPITNEGLLQTYKVSKEKLEKFDGKTGEVVDRYVAKFDEETGIKTYDEPEFVEDRVFEPAVQGTRGDAFYCGDTLGHIIKVGQTHKLESWDQVNCNDGVSCVRGLHVGNNDYIRGYQNAGTVTHRVFVDPMFIGAVPDDSEGAIRCKEYMVYNTLDKVTKNMYNSSTYAAQTELQWKEMLAEAVKANKEFVDKMIADAIEGEEQGNALSLT